MGDIAKPIATWISNNIPLSVGIVIFLFCLFFEISKIKIYPLRWLWKLISWPFKKVDEQRTESFKKLIESLKVDIDNKLSVLSTESTNNCASVKACFVDLEKRFDNLDSKQTETEERLDKLAAARIKNHVLNFARQCRKGEPHSHEDFANLFKEHQEYEALVAKYQAMDEQHKREWENNVYKHDFEYIQRVYDECNNKGEFIE